MNVVHVTAYLDPGLGYEENHLGPAQVAAGATVTIITSNVSAGGSRNGSGFDLGCSVYKGMNVVRLRTLGSSTRQPFMGLRKLGEAIDACEPDIVHVHSPVGLLTVQTLEVCKRRDIPVVLDSHLCYFNLRPYSWLKRRYYSFYRKLILPRYRAQIKQLLPLTPESADLLSVELGLDSSLMIHNTLGTVVDQFKPDVDGASRIRTKLGLDDGAQVIMFVGRVTPPKRVDVLIRAMEDAALDKAHLVVVGPVTDDYRVALLSAISDQTRLRIIFTRGVDYAALPAYFSAADVGVWPGDGAISIIDAMSCGLPVVLSRSESTSHLISAGNGRSYSMGDREDLSRILSEVLSDAARLVEMSRLARRTAERIYDWRQVAKRTLDIYRDVLEQRSTSVPTIW